MVSFCSVTEDQTEYKENWSTIDHPLYSLAETGRPMVDFVLEFRELAKTSAMGDSELRAWFLGGLDNLWYSRIPKNLLTGSLVECMYYDLQLSRSTPSGPSSKSSPVMAASRQSSPIMAADCLSSPIMAASPEPVPVKPALESTPVIKSVSALKFCYQSIPVPESGYTHEPAPKLGTNSETNKTPALLFTSAQRWRHRKKKWASATHPKPAFKPSTSLDIGINFSAREVIPVSDSAPVFDPEPVPETIAPITSAKRRKWRKAKHSVMAQVPKFGSELTSVPVSIPEFSSKSTVPIMPRHIMVNTPESSVIMTEMPESSAIMPATCH